MPPHDRNSLGVGGFLGHRAAESIDATVETKHWRESFKTAPYAEKDLTFADYEPAYRFGWESYARYPGRRFDDLDVELMRDWDAHRADSPLTWARAKAATRVAWERVEQRFARDHGSPDSRAPHETNATFDRSDD